MIFGFVYIDKIHVISGFLTTGGSTDVIKNSFWSVKCKLQDTKWPISSCAIISKLIPPEDVKILLICESLYTRRVTIMVIELFFVLEKFFGKNWICILINSVVMFISKLHVKLRYIQITLPYRYVRYITISVLSEAYTMLWVFVKKYL